MCVSLTASIYNQRRDVISGIYFLAIPYNSEFCAFSAHLYKIHLVNVQNEPYLSPGRDGGKTWLYLHFCRYSSVTSAKKLVWSPAFYKQRTRFYSPTLISSTCSGACTHRLPPDDWKRPRRRGVGSNFCIHIHLSTHCGRVVGNVWRSCLILMVHLMGTWTDCSSPKS